jgi:hypothetical protein
MEGLRSFSSDVQSRGRGHYDLLSKKGHYIVSGASEGLGMDCAREVRNLSISIRLAFKHAQEQPIKEINQGK